MSGKATKNTKVEATKLDIPIIGTFEGECADAEVTNENGLDITREVWENVFNSDIYKQGIDLGWFIGYLGHPEDPNCMEFKDACIIMTEGHIDDDGKVYGSFNLVDTPVGRIVKTFIDAGVTFGISVRGAGDIINNSVDPETFVFRGFDLVSFPAYKEAIPEFKAIAASTDAETKKKYDKVCASISAEIENISSCDTIDFLQEQFPEQSEIQQELEERKNEILEDVPEEKTLDEEKIDALTDLYLKEREKVDNLESQVEQLEATSEKASIEMNKKLHVITRIVAAQERDLDIIDEEYEKENKELSSKLTSAIKSANKLKNQLKVERDTNLQYLTKIEASDETISKQASTIQSLQTELDKTVIEAQTANDRASNLDDKVEKLQQKVEASQQIVEEYQDAYASLYARVLGVDLGNISVTASTTVEDLQKKINGTTHLPESDQYVEPQLVDFDIDDDTDLVTI